MSNAKTATSIAPITLREQSRRLDRFGALPLQRVAERVDLVHHQIDGAPWLGARAADRVVPFAQRAEQVGCEIQRARHHLKAPAAAAPNQTTSTTVVSVQRTSKL